jgi:hypothetical protein
MPIWRIPVPEVKRLSRSKMRVTFEKVDLTRRCVCGCYLGSHYFTYVPGGHMCSTCDTCDGFRAMENHQGTA